LTGLEGQPRIAGMSDESLQALISVVTRALTGAGYASEPDLANNASNAPAYLKVFCQGIPKNRRVDYLNLVFGGTDGERVSIEGEETIYTIPADLNALVERIRFNLPCACG
jgi:hypothetical protein